MLDILKTVTPSPAQWEIAIEGMRNSWNSWDKSDSTFFSKNSVPESGFYIGPKDMALMEKLSKNGGSHSKFRRMLPVWVTVNAPLYWWKEFDTYKVGTVCNSCSTMHNICSRDFIPDDFNNEYMLSAYDSTLDIIIAALNEYRRLYIKTNDKKYWEQIIGLLPSSYNQRRTVMANYEVLAKIFSERKGHKLKEWHTFCDWIETLPYSGLIICGQKPVL